MRRRPAAPDRLLATVLFTDIVGSTRLASEIGDRRWRHLVARHHSIVRGALKRHGGREIDTAGDGFFATFEQPGRAIVCALELTRYLRRLGIEIRAGINMGEVEVIGTKVGGIAVHVGSRVMSRASSGEVWVSSTVRDLMAGSEVRFEDRGVHELKGVPGEWRLYSVEAPPSEELPEEAVEAPATRRSWIATHRPQSAVISIVVVVALIAGIVALRGGEVGAVVPRSNSAVAIDPSTEEPVAVVPVGDGPTAIAVGDGAVWVISPANRSLGAIDPEGTLTPIGLPGAPTGIATDAGSVWITAGFGTSESGEGAVLRYSATTKRREQLIPIGDGVRGIAIGEGAVWVTNQNQNTVTKIDPETGRSIDEVTVGEKPDAIAVGSGSVWVGNVVDRTLSRLDPRTLEQVEIALPDEPTAIAVGFRRVWVTSSIGNSLTVIDAEANTLVKTLQLEGPRGVAVGAGAVWVALASGAIVRVDPTAVGEETRWRLPGPVEGVAVAADRVWVTVQG